MPPTTPATCGALNAAGAPCKSPPLTGTGRCLSHADERTRRRFGFGGPQPGSGRPRKHQQLSLAIDMPDGPVTDPRTTIRRAVWAKRLSRGVAALNPAERVSYDQALEALVACCRVRDRAEADGDEPLAAEARRRFPGFVDKVGEVAGAGPWPR